MSERMQWAVVKRDKVDYYLQHSTTRENISNLIRLSGVLCRVHTVRNISPTRCYLHLLYQLEGEKDTMHISWLELHEFTEPPTKEEIDAMKMLGYTWRENE